jgi:NadR type nicotinamide-nucleotide adenylyltransferase
MDIRNDLKRIVISGPESTGKTELAEALAKKFGTIWVPEYARTYIEQLDRPYTFHDVEMIAKVQVAMESEFAEKAFNGLLIFDTWLIITKVWFDVVYGHCPEWIIEHIASSNIDLFLVCDTDIPWVSDRVRENGGENRKDLFRQYCSEITSFGFKYAIVDGVGEQRLQNAINVLKNNNIG